MFAFDFKEVFSMFFFDVFTVAGLVSVIALVGVIATLSKSEHQDF